MFSKVLQIQLFPSYRHILTHLYQTTYENIVTKGEMAQYDQFLILPQCFQLFFVIIPVIIDIFVKTFSKSSAADMSYVGKG